MDYARQIATAQRLIAKYGADCVWADQTPGVVDPDTPWLPALPVPFSATPKIVFFSRNEFNGAFDAFLKGTDIQLGNQYGLMAQQTFIPALTAKVTRVFDSKLFAIKTIDTLAPNGIPILYTIDFVK